MKTSSIKWGIKFLAIIELTLFMFLFAHASYSESQHPVGNGRLKRKVRVEKTMASTTDLVVMDELFYAEPLANQ